MNVSVWTSRLAVASSRTTNLLFERIALAKQISYFCPTEKTAAAFDISVLRPFCKDLMTSVSPVKLMTSVILASEYFPSGSTF